MCLESYFYFIGFDDLITKLNYNEYFYLALINILFWELNVILFIAVWWVIKDK